MVQNQPMVIGLTGASGFLGQEIIRQAVSQGEQVVAYSRTPDKPVSEAIRTEAFRPGMTVSNLDTILHLAGESISGPWTKARRDRILQSRVQGTRWVVEALQNAPNPPRTLICASGVNIYGDRGEEELVEESPVGRSGFLCSVGVAWEAEAMRATSFGVRVVTIRMAMVLGRKGALPLMLPAFWLGLGGRLGSHLKNGVTRPGITVAGESASAAEAGTGNRFPFSLPLFGRCATEPAEGATTSVGPRR